MKLILICLLINSIEKIKQRRLKSLARNETSKHLIGIFLRMPNTIVIFL